MRGKQRWAASEREGFRIVFFLIPGAILRAEVRVLFTGCRDQTMWAGQVRGRSFKRRLMGPHLNVARRSPCSEREGSRCGHSTKPLRSRNRRSGYFCEFKLCITPSAVTPCTPGAFRCFVHGYVRHGEKKSTAE